MPCLAYFANLFLQPTEEMTLCNAAIMGLTQRVMCSVHSYLFSVHYILYSVQRTLYTVQCDDWTNIDSSVIDENT